MSIVAALKEILIPSGYFSPPTAKWLTNVDYPITTKVLPQSLAELMVFARRQGFSVRDIVRILAIHTRIPSFCTDKLINKIKTSSTVVTATEALLNQLYNTEELPFDLQELLQLQQSKSYILYNSEEADKLIEHIKQIKAGDELKSKIENIQYQNKFQEIHLREKWAFRIARFYTRYFTDKWPDHEFLKEILTRDFNHIFEWWKSTTLYKLQKQLCWIETVMKVKKEIQSRPDTDQHTTVGLVPWLANQKDLEKIYKGLPTRSRVNYRLSTHQRSVAPSRLEHVSRLKQSYINPLVRDIIAQQDYNFPHTARSDLGRWAHYLQEDHKPTTAPVVFDMHHQPTTTPVVIDMRYQESAPRPIIPWEKHGKSSPKRELTQPAIVAVPDADIENIFESLVKTVPDIHIPVDVPAAPVIKIDPTFSQHLSPDLRTALTKEVKDEKKPLALLQHMERASLKINTEISPSDPPTKGACKSHIGFITWSKQSCYIDSILLPFLYYHPSVFSFFLTRDLRADGEIFIEGHYQPLKNFPYLFFLQSKIQNFLQNAYQASNACQKFNIDPLRELFSIYIKVRILIGGKVTPMLEDVEWTNSQLEGSDVWSLLMEMFPRAPTHEAMYVTWTWSLTETDTKESAMEKAQDTTITPSQEIKNMESVITIDFPPDVSDNSIINLEYEIKKRVIIRGPNAPHIRRKHITAELLLYTPYFLVWIRRHNSIDSRGNNRRKLLTPVVAPATIPCEKGKVLRLVTIVEHIGNEDGGHYISYIKCKGGDWWRYDDIHHELADVGDALPANVQRNSTMYLYVQQEGNFDKPVADD